LVGTGEAATYAQRMPSRRSEPASSSVASPGRERGPRPDGLPVGSTGNVTIERLVAGGDGMGRLSDGRVVFVPGVVSGEEVSVEITSSRRDHAKASVVQVTKPSADRVEPPCSRVGAGCGGCSWQHITLAAQHDAKVDIVRDAFRRIGKMADADTLVRKGGSIVTAESSTGGWRTTVRAAITPNGRAGFRIAGSHDVCVTGPCLVAHPVISHILDVGRFPGSTEVQIRVGIAGRDTVVVVDGETRRIEMPDVALLEGFSDWSAPQVLTWDELHVGMPGAVNEEVAGVRLRVSAPSFFQSGPAAAALLVETIADCLRPYGQADMFADLYGGVGLFAATVGRDAKSVIIIEESLSSVNDAQFNLPAALVHKKDVTEWEPPRVVRRSAKTHVVADPARNGLGQYGVAAVLGAEPEVVVLVSCDAAAGARDLALFAEAGWTCVSATVLEVFPHTAHVEVVSVLESAG
jgi:23S rRNA (uracil1939-C5)-methyltransferase